MTTFKPDGYTSAAPYLLVDGAQGTIDFLKQVFGAEELRTYAAEDGRMMHAEVRIDDTVVMLADDPSPESGPRGGMVHVYVPDVDAVYRKALDAGAESVQEPVKKDDPDRRGGFRDAGGTTWWVGTKVE